MRTLTLFFFIVLLSLGNSQAQDLLAKDTSYWTQSGVMVLGFTNTGYSTYWQAGGLPSQSVLGRIDVGATYNRDRNSWENELVLAYGLLRQGQGDSIPFIKNEDRIELNSKYGFKFNEKLLASANFNFRTQFAPGFTINAKQPTAIPTDTISDFLSPAYLNFGVVLDFKPAKDVSLYYSPVNSKVTIVSNENFRPLYIPQDITTGAVRYEIGSNLIVQLKRLIAENVVFQTKATFFANYLNNFGNVDVNWTTLTTAKVNDWLSVSFSTNLIYDDDIRFDLIDENGNATGGTGPRTQFQHILNIGLTYNFL